MDQDPVDTIVEQWHRERPDIDVSGMEIIGRISRLDRMFRPRLAEVFSAHDLEGWEFDVLATLRRSGDPFQLSAGGLLDSMMVTSATMTNRIDRLEEQGLIRREQDPGDRRVVLVTLTDTGKSLVDAVVPEHAENEIQMLSSLTESERAELTRLLRKLHSALSTNDTE